MDSDGSQPASPRPGGHALVEQLVALGAREVFAVPGESYLTVLDGLYEYRDAIHLTVARQEAGATMMAVGFGKVTGTPGIAMVTRAPGATNGSIGVHIAEQDSVPLIVFVGQIPAEQRDRHAFQETDYRAMFGSLAKRVYEVEDPERLPEYVARAWHEAQSGIPGPVVVALPEGTTSGDCSAPIVEPTPIAASAPAAGVVEDIATRIAAAQRPLLLVGGQPWSAEALRALDSVAADTGLPVATTVRQQDLLRTDHPSYAGSLGFGAMPGLEEAVASSDLLIVVGSRIDAISNRDYELLPAGVRHDHLVHVLPDADVLGTVYAAGTPVVATPETFLTALEAVAGRVGPEAEDWREDLHSAYAGRSKLDDDALRRECMEIVREVVPAGTLMSGGAGNYTSWYQKHWEFNGFPGQVATQSGSMGFGLPGMVGALSADTSHKGVAWAGDGCILMNGQELSTAVRYGLDLLVIVINNERYGTIRMHQDREFPGRVWGTDLVNPDFAAYAEAFGATGRTVRTPAELRAALEELVPMTTPRLIEIQTP